VAEQIKIGSIIHLKNGSPNGGYLDTRGWVTDKPEFWNVSGTERTFVSTSTEPNRGGGSSGSWRIVSVAGKPDGTPLKIGDTIHLLNLYPDAGYLDCCGWIEHLEPFTDYWGKVTCGVFTSGARDRDNGTGQWTIRSANHQKPAGDPLLAGDAIYLENGYPAVDNGHPKTGFLVAQGKVTDNEVFKEYTEQQLFVFTHAAAEPLGASFAWTVTLSSLADRSERLFDYFRPELLKGRTLCKPPASCWGMRCKRCVASRWTKWPRTSRRSTRPPTSQQNRTSNYSNYWQRPKLGKSKVWPM
jgi:hypothetical protein